MPLFSRVACIGEVMVEMIAGDGDTAQLNVAGDTYNTAVYLAKLAGEVSVDYVTVLGKDRFSNRILKHMKKMGVGTDKVARHPTRLPGLYAIETDASGERSFVYWRSSSAARTLFDEDGRDPKTTLSSYELVLLSGISIAILGAEQRKRLHCALDDFRAKGGRVAFDSNFRPRLWNDFPLARAETEAMWRQTDIALPSLDDEMALFGDKDEASVVARLMSFGVSAGALKRGASGPLDLGSGGTRADVKPATRVVDTTAAGDSFNAGYLAGLAEGAPPEEALVAGHELALRVIAKPGAIVEIN